MNAERLQRDCDVALRIIREASALARDLRRELGAHALSKADRSPVTVADFAVQALVSYRLGRAFPEDSLVAEEDAATLRAAGAEHILSAVLAVLRRTVPDLTPVEVFDAIDRGHGKPAERFWTLDPVDGTQGFIRGDQYVVALALVVEGRVMIGILGCPQLTLSDASQETGTLVHAIRTRGAFRHSLSGETQTTLHVSQCRDPRRARVLRSVENDHIDVGAFDQIVRHLRIETGPTLMDSQAKHAVIAAGQADLLLRLPARPDYREKIWDQAAGTLIIEEAGGQVTDMRGIPLDFSTGRTLTRNRGVISSNGHLHAAVLESLRGFDGGTDVQGRM